MSTFQGDSPASHSSSLIAGFTPNPSNVLPELSLGGSKNDLSITLGLQGGQSESWNINNIPLQKWCNIIVTTTTRAVDTYIDGKLVRSARVYTPAGTGAAELPTIPPDGSEPVKLGETKLDAYAAKFKRWVYPINPQTAYSEYMKGNGQGWPGMPNFGLDMTIMKDNETYKEFSVF